MSRRMNRPMRDATNRPQSAPAARKAVTAPASPLHDARAGARPGTAKNVKRRSASAASRRRREIVGEYMRRSVDPVMRELVTHLLVEKPGDVTKAMLAYLRGVRDGALPDTAVHSRKVFKSDRAFMASQVKPLLTDLLSDVVRARPRAPVDFSIAWLSSRKAQVAAPKSVSKLRDAISFDAAITTQKPSTTLEKKRIFVLGDVSSGKTTLLKAMQGDLEPAAKPSGGFKTFMMDYQLDETAPQSQLTCFDVSGKVKARGRWPAYFSDCHAVIFVVDCSAELSEARACFDYCFRASSDVEVNDQRRAMLRGKPLLVLANKQDAENAHQPDAVAHALDLEEYQQNHAHIAVCPVISDPRKSEGALDPRVERALDWLAARVDENAGSLEARRTRETQATDAWDAEQKEKKAQRVFRKCLRKAHPQQGEPEECMSAEEGEEFFAMELGNTVVDGGGVVSADLGAMDPTAKRLAKLMNYQKLALQLTASMHVPVNPKKRAPMAWDDVALYVEARLAEAWDPAVVQRDEDEDPTSMKNRAKARA